jgi:hypothetical protein
MRTPKLPLLLALAGVVTAAFLAPAVRAEDPTDASRLSHTLLAKDAAGAWVELESEGRPPPSPKEWATAKPTSEERSKFYLPYVAALADKSKDYYTRFPTDSHAADAKLDELKYLSLSVGWGEKSLQTRKDTVQEKLLKDPTVPSETHFAILWSIAQDSPPDKAAPLLKEIVNGAAPERMKKAAADALKSMDRLGQEIAVAFTSVDGRSVDLSKLKGKVVLIDFWATW